MSIHFAHADGLCLWWWWRATKDSTTTDDLHQLWEAGSTVAAAKSLKSLPKTPKRSVNKISNATVCVACISTVGPLLRNAVQPRTDQPPPPKTVNVTSALAPQLPDGWTGITTGRDGGDIAFMNLDHALVDWPYSTGTPLALGYADNCHGTCNLTVPGAGFVAARSASSIPFKLDTKPGSNTSAKIFGMTITFNEDEDPDVIRISSVYKSELGCSSNLTVVNYTLTAANVNYDISLKSNGSALIPANVAFLHDKEYPVYDAQIMPVIGDPRSREKPYNYLTHSKKKAGFSTLGGIYMSLKRNFASSAALHYTNGTYRLETEGFVNVLYLDNSWNIDENDNMNNFKRNPISSCDLTWADPSRFVLQMTRDLIFSTAADVPYDIAYARSTERTNYDNVTGDPPVEDYEGLLINHKATQLVTLPIYKSSWLFTGLAIGVNLLSTNAVLPLFNRFWTLDETHSMSLKETALVFQQRTVTGLSVSRQNSGDGTGAAMGKGEEKANGGVTVREREVSPL